MCLLSLLFYYIGIVFNTRVYPIFFHFPPCVRYRFRYPRLCNIIPIVISLPLGIVFDTQQPEPAPLHYAGIAFNTYVGAEYPLDYADVSHFRRVLFSIPINLSLLLSPPSCRYRFRYPMCKCAIIGVFRRVLCRVSG